MRISVLTHEMTYIWYLPKKSKFSFSFILFRRFTVNHASSQITISKKTKEYL